ncbi:MAG: DJ-1/PfpI family protein [Actinomycetota bacterium]|nr:DJ-1/PfpI family protein [Actinomycetota bacterium]
MATLVKRIAFLAFPGMTLLDLVGAYDALRRVAPMGIDPEVSCRIVGTKQTIEDETGTTLVPDGVYEDLKRFDLLYVPGGQGTRRLIRDERFLEYLASWPASRPLASVCTGSLLLGAAGHLKGKRATTHHLALELLQPLCKEVITDRRIVPEGQVVSAAGVASALDLGLYLVEWLWGEEARVRIAAVMEYTAYRTA